MPAPAPWNKASDANAPPGRVSAALTAPLSGTSIVKRSSGVGTHAIMHAMTTKGTLHLGTSGWSFDGWKHGVFYPEGLKNREMLHYYSTQLSSVEINYTFRRFPTEKSLTTWREQAAEGFVFTLKANQSITHSKRLRDSDDDVRDFLDRARVLGDRLGCVLCQCPPKLHYDRELIERFVGYLPPGPPAFAMEFRHASWNEAKDLL